MSVEAISFSGSSALQPSEERTPLRLFLALTLLLPTVIVIANFIIGVLTPITAGADDDMTLIDGVWRLEPV